MQVVFRITRMGPFDVALWLHTQENPSDAEWDHACHELLLLKQRNDGDLSQLRTLILSDIAKLITAWLDPGFRTFTPEQTREALTYVELLTEEAAVWKHFDDLAKVLGGVTETLRLARKATVTATGTE